MSHTKFIGAEQKKQPIEDEKLVTLTRYGDHEAFGKLYFRYKGLVQNKLRQLAPDRKNCIEDLCQEIFLKAFTNVARIRNPKNFKAWLLTVTRNEMSDHMRKFVPQKTTSLTQQYGADDEFERQIPDRRYGPERLAQQHEIFELVKEAIEDLPPQFRQATYMRDLEQKSYQQIANETETDLGTVKSRVSRGRAKIRSRVRHLLAS